MRDLFKGLSFLLLLSLVLTACNKEDDLIDDGGVEATCTDGIQNGDETGVDCGGSCDPCTTTPTCDDGIQNGDETGVDCGGSCDPCTTAPTCDDGIQNGDETGVDCGGSCDPCTTTPTCDDGIQNGDETGVDCGGSCDPCTTTPTCDDGIQNGDETGVDCGGSCDPCTSSLTIKEHIAQHAQFSMLNEAIERADFDIAGAGPYTFFAPNNAAWEAMLENNGWTSIDQISPGVLKTILEYHVSDSGPVTSDQFTHAMKITIRYQSKEVQIDLDDPNNPGIVAGLTSADLVGLDQMTTNGVIHEIDKVLLF